MKKCSISDVFTKNRIICDTDSINRWILADEASHFTSFQILCHNDIITILY